MPITIEVEVPNHLHKLLSGPRKRELMQTYDVHILVPTSNETPPTDMVKVCSQNYIILQLKDKLK